MKYNTALKNAKQSNFSERFLEDLFIAEQFEADNYEHERKYAGMDADSKRLHMQMDCDEASACNDVYDYYN